MLFRSLADLRQLRADLATHANAVAFVKGHITHTGYILDYVNADRGQVMYDGVLCCDTRPIRPRDILDHIGKYGYKECIRCLN